MRFVGFRMIGAMVAMLALPGLAQAGPARRTHDGFFLRLSAGLGYASTSIDVDDPILGTGDLEFDGLDGDSNIAIGGMVAKNLALHGTLWAWMVGDPDLELNGDQIGELNGDLTMAAFGIGITRYFMPANTYITGSIGLGELQLDLNQGFEGDSDLGFVMDLGFGRNGG